jgi:transcription elongation factor Elf1
MSPDQVIESRQWEVLAQENREREETANKVEVEIWHNGVLDVYYSKLRKIGKTRNAESGMIEETWEPVVERDMPQTFTVMLHEGTLESHLQLCRFRETDHGARLIQRLGYIAMILIYIPLLSSLGGLIPSEVDLLAWYWIAPISAVAGMFGTMAYYNKVTVCQRIVLECAVPSMEEGGNHLCYICHSKTANVVEQLNALDRYVKWMPALVEGHNENLGASRVADRDRIAWLEWQLNEDRDVIQHRAFMDISRRLSLGQAPGRKAGLSPATVATALVLVVMAVALLVYYGV